MFTLDWVVDNFISEIIFGVILLGLIGLAFRYIKYLQKAIRVFRIISIHNTSSRTRRKGIHARDRFMDVYEAKEPLLSRMSAYNTGFIEGIYSEFYIDKGILEYHGLVKVIGWEERGGAVSGNNDRVTRWVYKFLKKAEEKEKNTTENFVLDKSHRFRRLPEDSN